MATSLQEQLLKAGLVDTKKAKQIQQEKRKQAKQQPKGHEAVNEAAERALQARAEKAAKDREANLARQQEAERKALEAQVRQIVQTHRIDRRSGQTAYQFADDRKIKKIYVTDNQFEQLACGQIAIARFGDQYELVPSRIAERLVTRLPESIVPLKLESPSAAGAEDDPYKDYPIPDDLMW